MTKNVNIVVVELLLIKPKGFVLHAQFNVVCAMELIIVLLVIKDTTYMHINAYPMSLYARSMAITQLEEYVSHARCHVCNVIPLLQLV